MSLRARLEQGWPNRNCGRYGVSWYVVCTCVWVRELKMVTRERVIERVSSDCEGMFFWGVGLGKRS